ncbi:putative RING-H2 finger protein ATL71 [Punica granatum]|uniref:RING-type domain-containing protein n=2 Tax=Punica granatum TaxID=22663 RepID=A0A218XRT5_PUNGR|nr:putative RING-H2 finger protein ATL71 [Punica granatum]OWM87673.1 hypothetical protein CDL15_Pgr022786 [Punica granatum]PKI43013.1 hypothetical protein CRG98_036591 [Punica granatum]
MSTINGILPPLGVLLFLTVIVLLSYFYARRRQDSDTSVRLAGASAPSDHDSTDGDDDEDRELGLDEATILSYPKLQYSQAAKDVGEADLDDSNNTCPVCLLDYQETDTVRVLPECKHFFHHTCVDPWLKLHSTCPICREQLIRVTDFHGDGISSPGSTRRQESNPSFTVFMRP